MITEFDFCFCVNIVCFIFPLGYHHTKNVARRVANILVKLFSLHQGQEDSDIAKENCEALFENLLNCASLSFTSYTYFTFKFAAQDTLVTGAQFQTLSWRQLYTGDTPTSEEPEKQEHHSTNH